MHVHRGVSSEVVASAIALVMVLSAVTAFSVPARADHDTVDWSNFWSVTFDPRSQYYPAAFADGQGHLYVFYYDVDNSGNTNVTVAKYATRGANGNPQLQFRRQVNPTVPNVAIDYNFPYGFGWAPSSAMDHNGNLYVAWADRNYNISVSKSADGGQSWGVPARVDPPAVNSWDTGPVLVAAPSGTLYIAWLQYWGPGGVHSITVARSVDQGTTWTGKVNVTTSSRVGYWTHDLAVDSSDRLYLAYSSIGVFPDWHVNYTWSDGGTIWSPSTRLDGGSWAYSPVLAVDAANRVHVAWYDSRQSTSGMNTYWYRRSDDRGVSWTMEVPVSQGRYSTGGGYLPTIAAHGDTVIVGWTEYSGSFFTFGFAISADGGDLWYPEDIAQVGSTAYAATFAADENGTFYGAFYRWNEFFGSYDAAYSIWDGPPSAPAITGIVRGATSLDVSWSGSPEGDVSGYRLWRSSDGVTYELVGTFDAATRSDLESGLSNGTYWYRVTSFDVRGTSSHSSDPMSATVGKTTAEMVADIEAQIAALQAQLNSAQVDITAIQTQLDSLQTQLTNLQSTTDTDYASLQSQINDLRSRLDAIRSEQATQSQTWLLTLLVIVVIVLLVFMFLQQRRMSAMRSQLPRSMRMPPPEEPPAPPSMAPSQPSQAPPLPEDDL